MGSWFGFGFTTLNLFRSILCSRRKTSADLQDGSANVPLTTTSIFS